MKLNYLIEELKNLNLTENGICGVLGNLIAESKIKPNNMQDRYEGKYNDDTYTQGVDNGLISKEEFSNDGVGYGIAQWTYHTRKRNLYEFYFSNTDIYNSISDLKLQTDFLILEMKNYKKMMKILKDEKSSIYDCSTIFLTEFEKPANMSDAVKKYRCELSESTINTVREVLNNKDERYAEYYRVFTKDGLQIISFSNFKNFCTFCLNNFNDESLIYKNNNNYVFDKNEINFYYTKLIGEREDK